MNSLQIKTVKVAMKDLKLDDADYRQILREVAGVESCKQLTNASMEDVMAHFEHRGFRQVGRPGDYWRMKTWKRGTVVDARQVFLLRELSAQIPRYQLPGLCRRFSHHRTEDVAQLTLREAYELHEMLKKAIAREREREGANGKGRTRNELHVPAT